MSSDKPCDVEVQDRREYVFTVGLDKAEQFAAGVSAHLTYDPHRERRDGSHLYITTLYFDSSDHAIARACEKQRDNIKLRAREYHDRGAAVDTGPEPLLWLEVKARAGMRTRKLRLSLPTGEVRGMLREGGVDSWLLHLREDDELAANEAMLRELVELCNSAEGPLLPACLAHYRRRAWQDESASTRVTLDTELTFYRAKPEFFTQYTTLSEALDEPVLRAEHGVIEIKLRGECPSWLEEILGSLGIALGPNTNIEYSKFLAASAAVAARV